MRSIYAAAVAAALATPVLASAQLIPATSPFTTSYAGCNLYLCGTLTVVVTSPPQTIGTSAFTVRIAGTITPLAAAFASGGEEIYSPQLTGPVFEYQDTGDLGFLDPVSLVGHAAGDVIPFASGPQDTQVVFGPGPVYRYEATLDRIVGAGVGVPIDLVLTETPEPAPLALTLGGLAVLGAVGWRRRTA